MTAAEKVMLYCKHCGQKAVVNPLRAHLPLKCPCGRESVFSATNVYAERKEAAVVRQETIRKTKQAIVSGAKQALSRNRFGDEDVDKFVSAASTLMTIDLIAGILTIAGGFIIAWIGIRSGEELVGILTGLAAVGVGVICCAAYEFVVRGARIFGRILLALESNGDEAEQ